LVLITSALSPSAVLGSEEEPNRPARGVLWGTGTFTPSEPGFLTGVSTGSGYLSSIGKVTFRSEQTQDAATGIYTGTGVTTAANGDTISASFSGVVRPTASPRVFRFRHENTITGGTGRFSGATGTSTVTGISVIVSVDSQTGVTRTKLVAFSVGP
jgi:hypothetical protein